MPSSRLHSRQPSKSNVLLLTASKLTNKNTEQNSPPFEKVLTDSVNSKKLLKEQSTLNKDVRSNESLDNDIKMFGLRFSTQEDGVV